LGYQWVRKRSNASWPYVLNFVSNFSRRHKITIPNLFRCLSEREPGSSVSIVSGYGLDDRAIEVRSPAEAKGFFL
jgi:hypothetical protein